MPRRKVKMRKRKIWVEEADDKYLSIISQGRISEEYRRCVKRRIYADIVCDELLQKTEEVVTELKNASEVLLEVAGKLNTVAEKMMRIREIISHMYSI